MHFLCFRLLPVIKKTQTNYLILKKYFSLTFSLSCDTLLSALEEKNTLFRALAPEGTPASFLSKAYI